MNKIAPLRFLIIFSFLFVLSACQTETITPTTVIPATPLQTPLPPLTPTQIPTNTPQPPAVYLLAPSEADPQLVTQVEPVIEEIAGQTGVVYHKVQSFDGNTVPVDAAAVVVLPPAPAQDLAVSSPGTRFVAIGYGMIDSPDNLLVIEQLMPDADQMAFAAGYTAAVISNDWRVGVLSVSDTEQGTAARNAFLNGAEYFCGLCRPSFPPYYDAENNILQYPTYMELPSSASEQDWQAAAQWLADREVEVVYFAPGADVLASVQLLAEAGVIMIGGRLQTEPAPSTWAATIGVDSLEIFKAVLPGIITGGPGPDTLPGLSIIYANEKLFSPGKQQLVASLIKEINAGRIQTLPLP